jgi:hypothetical protein
MPDTHRSTNMTTLSLHLSDEITAVALSTDSGTPYVEIEDGGGTVTLVIWPASAAQADKIAAVFGRAFSGRNPV